MALVLNNFWPDDCSHYYMGRINLILTITFLTASTFTFAEDTQERETSNLSPLILHQMYQFPKLSRDEAGGPTKVSIDTCQDQFSYSLNTIYLQDHNVLNNVKRGIESLSLNSDAAFPTGSIQKLFDYQKQVQGNSFTSEAKLDIKLGVQNLCRQSTFRDDLIAQQEQALVATKEMEAYIAANNLGDSQEHQDLLANLQELKLMLDIAVANSEAAIAQAVEKNMTDDAKIKEALKIIDKLEKGEALEEREYSPAEIAVIKAILFIKFSMQKPKKKKTFGDEHEGIAIHGNDDNLDFLGSSHGRKSSSTIRSLSPREQRLRMRMEKLEPIPMDAEGEDDGYSSGSDEGVESPQTDNDFSGGTSSEVVE